jgi:hypothetical protein
LTANSGLAKVVSVKFAARPQLCIVMCETTIQVINLSVHQVGGHPSTGFPEILDTETGIAEFLVYCHHEQMPRSRICSTTST